MLCVYTMHCVYWAISLRPPVCHVIIAFTHTTLYLFSVSAWTLAWGWFIALSFAVLVIALECDRQTGIILYKLKQTLHAFWQMNDAQTKDPDFPPRECLLWTILGKIWCRYEGTVRTWLIPKARDKWLRCLQVCGDVQECCRSVRQTGWSWNIGLPSLVTSRENYGSSCSHDWDNFTHVVFHHLEASVATGITDYFMWDCRKRLKHH